MLSGIKGLLVTLSIIAFPLIILELICFFPEKIRDKILKNHTAFNIAFFIFYAFMMYLYTQNII
jgi:hypothetical protein